MSDAKGSATRLAESLERHVLAPIETANAIAETEYGEVEAERRAFVRFRGRVASLESASSRNLTPSPRTQVRDPQSRRIQRLRSAFRETVMSVDHYDDVYGESLVEHVAAELSVEIAAGLERTGHLQFTNIYKRALLSGIDSAIDQRETFCAILDGERESLTQSRDTLVAVLDELDGTYVSVGTRTEFADALDELAYSRQETFASRTASPRTDGHDLCAYLYTNCGWTYPVLTAVARLRGTVNGMVT